MRSDIITVNFTSEFRNYFKNKQCELFHAPFDAKLKSDKEEYINKVIPDITVICDKHDLTDKNYIDVPTPLAFFTFYFIFSPFLCS